MTGENTVSAFPEAAVALLGKAWAVATAHAFPRPLVRSSYMADQVNANALNEAARRTLC